MRKVSGYVKTSMVGSTSYFEFEVEDDATDRDIEELALDAMHDHVEWNYEVEGDV